MSAYVNIVGRHYTPKRPPCAAQPLDLIHGDFRRSRKTGSQLLKLGYCRGDAGRGHTSIPAPETLTSFGDSTRACVRVVGGNPQATFEAAAGPVQNWLQASISSR